MLKIKNVLFAIIKFHILIIKMKKYHYIVEIANYLIWLILNLKNVLPVMIKSQYLIIKMKKQHYIVEIAN